MKGGDMMNNNLKTRSMLCLILGIINIVMLMLLPVDYINVCSYVSILLGVGVIVCYALSKNELNDLKNTSDKKIKNQAKTGFILSIICVCLSFINLLSLVILNDPDITSQIYCIDKKYVSNCATTSDEVTTCRYMDTLDIQCYTEVLDDEQYK